MNPLLLDLDREALRTLLAQAGEPAYRAHQVWQWLHGKRVSAWESMTDLPKALRQRLQASHRLRSFAELEHRISRDGLTEKWLFMVAGRGTAGPTASEEAPAACDQQAGDSAIETVLIREQHLSRKTVCVSAMIGCPLGCSFCATGSQGFVRNLSRGEMIEQAYRADAAEARGDDAAASLGRAISNVVFMGMGEPLLNLDEVLAAARVFADPEGLGLSGRHITISTVGVTEGIQRLAAEKAPCRLALSLHAPDQALREKLIPAAKRWPLAGLMQALRGLARVASRGITIEYCLIDGKNAGADHARSLARLLADLPCKVNLIPLNPVEGFAGQPPGRLAIQRFQEILERAGLVATLRTEKGQDIEAACGQLRARRLPSAGGRPGGSD